MTDEKILAKVRALLAHADDESGITDEARELYAQKAAELMAKYAIDEALLSTVQAADDPVESRTINLDAPYAVQKSFLLHVIAEALNCQTIRTPVRARGGQTVNRARVFGRRSDLERVEFLYTSLLVQAVSLVSRAYPGDIRARVNTGTTRSYRASWFYGFAVRIKERMAAGVAEAVREAGTPGAALVLVDRAKDAQRALRAEYPSVRQTRARAGSADGYGAGKAAGGRADLGHGRVGGNRRAIG